MDSNIFYQHFGRSSTTTFSDDDDNNNNNNNNNNNYCTTDSQYEATNWPISELLKALRKSLVTTGLKLSLLGSAARKIQ